MESFNNCIFPFQTIILMKLIKEFKEFAIKGNMIDIAIGVIIGTAFNKVVDALVKEVFMPPLSFLTGGNSFQDKRVIIQEGIIENGITKVEEIAIGYGKLIEATADFLIIGFTVFLVVKFMNRIRKKAENPQDEAEVTPKDIELLNKIADLMEQQVSQLEAIKEKR